MPIEPNKKITLEQAAEYINKSSLGKLGGRVIGPFKGMSKQKAKEAATKIIKEHFNNSQTQVTKPILPHNIQKALKQTGNPVSQLKEKVAVLTSNHKTNNHVDDSEISPSDDSVALARLKLLSKDIGIDLVNLAAVVVEKYNFQKKI